MSITEQQLADIMPLNAQLGIREIRDALGMTHTTTTQVAQWLRPHKQSGYLDLTVKSNKASKWFRLRAPKRIPPSKPKRKRQPLPFEIEKVSVGGSTSSHYGSSEDKPTTVSLPKMPDLRAV